MKRNKVLAGVALMSMLAITGCSSLSEPSPSVAGLPDDGCTPVVVATSSEKVNLMEKLGAKFKESQLHSGLDNCATVIPTNVASGKASEYLNESTKEWRGTTAAPSVWSPASSVWVERVASIAGESVVEGSASFTKTPIVFGVPESMAEALGYPDKELSIQEIKGLIENPEGWGTVGKKLWGDFKIAKTNPNTSTTGLSTILMQSYSASGKAADLTVDDVNAAEEFSRAFELGAIHYGDTTGKVLMTLADNASGSGSSYVSAVALEETSLYNYNLGNPDSHTVQPGEVLTPPKEKLVAVYPTEGSMFSDNPAVVLKTDWVAPEEASAAAAFVEFLHTTEAQESLPEYGFRALDETVDASKTLNASVGIDTAYPKVELPQPAPEVVSTALDQWANIRKPSAVLQLIDISGSMDESIGNGKTRLDGAIEGSQSTLDTVRSTDQIGVWAFTTNISDVVDGEEIEGLAVVRPFSELAGDKEGLSDSIGDLANSQRAGTPLYDSIAASYDYMKSHAESGRINAIVVLSDGQDTDSTITLESLIQKIKADNKEGGNNAPVRIFPIAYSSGADMESLEKLAKASGGQVFDATDPARIAETFRSVMNNF